MNTWMVDQSDRHDVDPNSNSAKLARAVEYLRSRNLCATTPGNDLRYLEAAKGSSVLRKLRKKAA